MPEPPGILTPAEAAALFGPGVDSKRLARWAASGRVPSFRTAGGHHRYRLPEIAPLAAVYRRPGDWATVAEVAAALGVDPSTVTGRARSGRLAGAVKGMDRHWRVPRATLDAILAGKA